MLKAQSIIRVRKLVQSNLIAGDSPPAVFVGRIGYPKVLVGPMIPPIHGDTQVMDTPEFWLGWKLGDILDFRYQLIRGVLKVEVTNQGKFITELQEMLLSRHPVSSEMLLERSPYPHLTLSEDLQPMGPSAPLVRMRYEPGPSEPNLEKVYYDDLPAQQAIMNLYEAGLPVSRIQKALSLGMLGSKKRRKLVPTRWSITAVDSTISQGLVSELKQYPWVSESRVYHLEHLSNLIVIIMIPGSWSFEWAEAWYPRTTWNPEGQSPIVMADHELFWGRGEYPEIGGCYYASRLAVSEKLREEKRQAVVVALREIKPGFPLPLGVWFVRELMRRALRQTPATFNEVPEALSYAASLLNIPLEKWLEKCELLRMILHQKKLREFL